MLQLVRIASGRSAIDRAQPGTIIRPSRGRSVCAAFCNCLPRQHIVVR